jgi:hypothetical protein
MLYRNFFNPFAGFFPFILGIIVLDLAVKGLALWRSARNTQKVWFIVLLIVNSAGILPAIYLLFFQNRKNK